MDITRYQINNTAGDIAVVSDLGARLVSWHTKVDDEKRNIVVGYKEAKDYITDTCYLGAIVGPFANRIANASYVYGGKKVQLIANEGNNLLHGGAKSLEAKKWQVSRVSDSEISLTLALKSGFNGNEGQILFNANYSLSEDNDLNIRLTVNSEKTVAIGPTAHPYFNLMGDDKDILQHQLKLNSSSFTPVDEEGIPTGEIVPCNGSGFSFENFVPIANSNSGNIDNNFLIDSSAVKEGATFNSPVVHAQVKSPDEKLMLTAKSNYPAIQIYTGKHLQPPINAYQGFCLEPQFCPNSPNEESFPFRFTGPNNPLVVDIIYSLTEL